MSGPSDIDHVEIPFFDHPVEMDVDEIQTGRRSPVSKQPWLDMFEGEWFLQKGVIIKIDLADR